MEAQQHWENLYQTKSHPDLSWYEADPRQSFDYVLAAAGDSRGSVIDVGGGQSYLVDRLLDAGFERVAVLDISHSAIEATKIRLGNRAAEIEWIVADITQVKSLGEFDIWHDRAVFHFITDAEDRRSYLDLLKRTLPLGGHFVVGTFAVGGPEKCSGLQIQQYDQTTMGEALGPSFELVRGCNYEHMTPSDKPQLFFFGIYRRVM